MTEDAHLCVTCSLCCNGSLFDRVPVTDEDVARLGGGPDFFVKPDGALRMKQRCSRLGTDGACGCYDIRPQACRTYRCRLLRRMERGDVDRTEAGRIVQAIKAQQDRTVEAYAHANPGETIAATDTATGASRAARAVSDDKQRKDTAPLELDEAEVHFDAFVALVRLYIKADFRT